MGKGDSPSPLKETLLTPVNGPPLLETPYNNGPSSLKLEAGRPPPYYGRGAACSFFWFRWLNPLLKTGLARQLESGDMPDLPRQEDVKINASSFRTAVRNERRRKRPSLCHAFLSQHGRLWFALGLVKGLSVALSFAGPLLLNKMLDVLEALEFNIWEGLGWVGAMGATSIISAIIDCHYNFAINRLQVRIRNGLVPQLLSHMLLIAPAEKARFGTGQITNLMSVDCQKIIDSVSSFHQLWTLPFQVAITLYLLYTQVHWAFLAGLALLLVITPMNLLISKRIGTLTQRLMSAKDERVQITEETIAGIRTVRMHSWEVPLSERIRIVRQLELKHLKARKYLDAICVYLWAAMPVLVPLATFSTVVWMQAHGYGYDHSLSTSAVFTSLSLLHMLIFPMNAFPWVLTGIMEAAVSLRRLNQFLVHSAERKPPPLLSHIDPRAVARVSGSFTWPASTGFELKVPAYTLLLGSVTIVVGPVGSGKTAFLSCLLRELVPLDNGQCQMVNDPQIAYSPQVPWIRRQSIRDNIVNGHAYEPDRYLFVLKATCLNEDLRSFPQGDESIVGERGYNLSGGQRRRVSLARALYSKAPILLLDDPLSSLDSHVAATVWKRALAPFTAEGRGREQSPITDEGRAIVMAMSTDKYCRFADTVVRLHQGDATVTEGDAAMEEKQSPTEEVQQDRGPANPSTSKAEPLDGDILPGNQDGDNDEEAREKGVISRRVCTGYAKAVGVGVSTMVLLSLLFMQLSRNASDWWLAQWSAEVSERKHATLLQGAASAAHVGAPWDGWSDSEFLLIYGVICAANSLFTLFRAFFFAFGGLRGARRMHSSLLQSIMQAPMSFFDRTPTGRLINRFGRDVFTVDESLPFQLNIFLAQSFSLFGSLLVLGISTRGMLLVIVPVLIALYYRIQKRYRASSRELKRLDSVTRSPLYETFGEVGDGSEVVVGLGDEPKERRYIIRLLDENMTVSLTASAASQWLSLRLQGLGSLVITSVALLAVVYRIIVGRDLRHGGDPGSATEVAGLAGLALSYALPIVGSLQGLLSSFTETEKEMVAVERIEEYVNTPGEASKGDPRTGGGTEQWPASGTIDIQSLTLRYRPSLPPALRDVSLHIPGGAKVVILGRTGSGKTSLVSCLLRLYPWSKGTIAIDGVSVEDIPPAFLRSRLAVIPQDPLLFAGSVRYNLDPLGMHGDEDLLLVLETCFLRTSARHSVIPSRVVSLDTQVTHGGRNWSLGERQLLCLARALLSRAKIVIIDEATASVDDETDRRIRQVITTNFRESTVITIAHRLGAIDDSSLVVVMEDGKVVECGSPQALLEDPHSATAKLVRASKV